MRASLHELGLHWSSRHPLLITYFLMPSHDEAPSGDNFCRTFSQYPPINEYRSFLASFAVLTTLAILYSTRSTILTRT